MSLYNKIIDLQKLERAWQHVKKNKPAAGVDHVTAEQFDAEAKENLKQLHLELAEHSYETLPVKQVTIYKGEKAREIALYAMRDKVVQQSIAAELNKMYDPLFSSQTYAYRSNRSALSAIDEIAQRAGSGQYAFYLKIDISHFFDTIQWPRLRKMLEEFIREGDVLDLIRMNACSKKLDPVTGELAERKLGLYQGSGIAPVLSNIYLMEFDRWMKAEAPYFVRYSDDLIALGGSREQVTDLLLQAVRELEKLGLAVNQDKSSMGEIAEGVDFLGYHLDQSGKSIPAKAEGNLRERLEMMWLTEGGLGFEDRMRKALEIIGGWEQYFREQRDMGSILEYAAVVFAAQGDVEMLQKLRQQRHEQKNIYRDIALFLGGIWHEQGWKDMELLEYEQYYQMPELLCPGENLHKTHQELISAYTSFFHLETAEGAAELMQCYTDLQAYAQAEFWMKKREEMEANDRKQPAVIPEGNRKELVITNATSQKFRKLFAGREDIFAKEQTDRSRHFELQTLPLTEKEISAHLCGDITLGTYIQRPNGTVRFIVFDVDVSKKMLLQCENNAEAFQAYYEKALRKSLEICDVLKKLGLKGYLEDSGNRGYHVWVFLSEWIPVRYANLFSEVVQAKLPAGQDDEINLEFFPNQTRIKPGKYGQVLRLPYGIHGKSGRRSGFLDEELRYINELDGFMDSVAQFSLAAIKKVLAVNTGIQEREVKKVVDEDLSSFGKLAPSIQEILTKCNLMRYLCQKAAKTGYLTHFERLSVLYVFGHIGDEGKAFVHQVMELTLNYQYNVTEKFIRKLPEKPISCIKLRDQYKQITAEYGCNCSFKRTKNCYPSPVLHAISLSNDLQEDVTLPTSRSMPKEKEKKVLDEINIHSRAQELAVRILELKKQKRGLDKAVHKLENGLEEIFDNAKIDCLEIEMGMLVRRKKEDGYEWLIEI